MSRNENDDVKKTVKSMIIGAILYNFFVLIGVIIFSIIYKGDTIYILKNVLAVFVGCIMCVLGIYSLYKSVLRVVDETSEKNARSYMIFNFIIRIFVFCIVLIVIMNFIAFDSGIIFAISVLGIKIGAYLAPMIKNKIKIT